MYHLIRNADVMSIYEENPLGIALIELDGGSVALFASAKLTGTVAAAVFLVLSYHKNRRYGSLLAGIVAVFMSLLLFYLVS